MYRLNALTFRDSAGGGPPWLSADVVDELEWQSAGDVAWEVDVLSADGREHTVLLDSAAQVLDVGLGD